MISGPTALYHTSTHGTQRFNRLTFSVPTRKFYLNAASGIRAANMAFIVLDNLQRDIISRSNRALIVKIFVHSISIACAKLRWAVIKK